MLEYLILTISANLGVTNLMGSNIEINDTLQLTKEQGFPCDILNLAEHSKKPRSMDDLKTKVFTFHKEDARIFHLDPCRVFLVENISGKWLFWGHALIQSQEVKKRNPGPNWKQGDWDTFGTYVISQIYDPEFQRAVTLNQSPPGKSYF